MFFAAELIADFHRLDIVAHEGHTKKGLGTSQALWTQIPQMES